VNRREKELVVQSMRESFAKSSASFVIGYKGMTVNDLQSLRTKLRKDGGSLKVAKARLMKLAVKDLNDAQALEPFFKEQIGIVFVSNEAPAVAKVLSDFSKDHQALKLIVGRFDGQLLDRATIIQIASLPSKEVLLARLCATLQSPLVKLAVALKQVEEKKQ
jgi:large subunit ribosomal protein L10